MRILSVFKFILAVLLLPLVISVTVSFMENLRFSDAKVALAFGWGVIAYLIVHILFYEPAQLFESAKKMTEQTVGFLFPLVKIAGFCIPFFTIAAFLAYIPASKIWPQANLLPLFVFLASFMFTMHMVFTANALKGKQAGWLKENYLLSIFLIYVVNLVIIAVAFSFLMSDFSLVEFFKRCGEVASAITTASFEQLFDVRKVRV